MKKKITKEIPARFKYWKEKLDRWSVPAKISFFILGIISTTWFLIRVIPKPSRAAYPCMRTAAPFMSALLVYLLSFSRSFLAFRKARANINRARYAMAGVFTALTFIITLIFFGQDVRVAIAQTMAVKGVLPDAPNSPMGITRGIHQGRVVLISLYLLLSPIISNLKKTR